jgi:hypothetical protein
LKTTTHNSKHKVLPVHVIMVYGGNGDTFTHILKLLLDGMSVYVNK